MKKHLLPFVLLFLYSALPAQRINWAFNITETSARTRLTTDRHSNLYLYGYLETFHPNDNEGTLFRKYSPGGELLVDRSWKGKFFISSMINDGAGHFYFCGHFSGNIHDQGISLDSQGGSDGFFGRMDEEGNIEWTIGFGGVKEDEANDITFNNDSTEILLTGGVDATVILYDYPIITTTQAIFVARFDLAGGMLSNKTYVFTPDEYGDNIGLELAPDGGDGYYLLADRKGDHWSNEATPSGSPMEGRHIFRLDNDMNIMWSSFIISSGCYYGYSSSNMEVHEGKACVPSFCSGKYGGTGRLRKLDKESGSFSWEITNDDGSYYDTYVSGKNLLYVGNEEANGCPCEDNNPGFGRVKMLDENNQDRILLSKYAFHFYNITQAPNGNIYVFGGTWTDDPHLEGRTLSKGYFLFSMNGDGTASENNSELLSSYPNPSSGYVEIVHNKPIRELVVLNGSGTIVRQVKPDALAYTIRDLAPGYYIVRAKDADGYRTGKVLVATDKE